jgi:CRP/FNR family cyclic AMP-dependent transcriptional regulator
MPSAIGSRLIEIPPGFVVIVIFPPQGLLGFARRWLNYGMKPPVRIEPRKPGESIDRLSLIRNQSLFSHLAPAALEQLASRMTRKSVRRGTVIFAKDDPGTGLIGVIRGSVKISVMSGDGREAVLNIINTGEVFGEMALLDGRPRSADAAAMTDCELVSIDRSAFISVLRDDPEIAIKIIEILCARLRRASERMQDVMHLNGPARLAKTILQLAGNAETAAPARKAKITQREISQIVGLSREMTNKLLRSWQRSRWVRLERGGVAVLRPDQLEKTAAETIVTV